MTTSHSVGITAYGVFLPRLRVARSAIAQAHAWAFPSMRGKGHKALCSWDEDSITLGVEAGRDCLGNHGDIISRVTLASTTAPFADLQNASTIATALGLSGQVSCADLGGSTRSGIAGLINELSNPDQRQRLFVASERRSAKPASAQEMNYGSGAVAMLVGEGERLASYLGSESINVPFIDHYRMNGQDYDYYAEERWVRDEGVGKLVPTAVDTLLKKAGISAADISWFGLGGAPRGSDKLLVKKLGLGAATLLDDFQEEIGNTGSAHSLLQLADALEKAETGQLILLAAFGQGCDVAIFRKEAGTRRPHRGVRGALAEGIEETSYLKMLSFEGELNVDWGPRSEVDTKASIAQQYRSHEQILAFVGGRCEACGSVQFPSLPNCVNCGEADSQVPASLADQRAQVATLSADWLQYYPAPPLYVGLAQFDNGARLLMEIVDVGEQELDVGTPLKMVFRIKANDKLRGYRRYFWKAAPATQLDPSIS